jgi:RES domain-containing protein
VIVPALWRVCRAPFAALDGEGARLYGGRWNPVGTPLVYTATTLALAALETLAHTDPDLVPDDLVALRIETGGLDVPVLDEAALPEGWRTEAAESRNQAFGGRWVNAATSALVVVPSALLPGAAAPAEANVLFSPALPDASRVRIAEQLPFSFDDRLLFT